MGKINFSVSNLFVIMNMNYFKKFDKVVFSVWRQFNRSDYQKFSKLSTEVTPDVVPTRNFPAEFMRQRSTTDVEFAGKVKNLISPGTLSLPVPAPEQEHKILPMT